MSVPGRGGRSLPGRQCTWAKSACLKNARGIEATRFSDIGGGKYMLYWLTKFRAREKSSSLTTQGWGEMV